MNIWMRNVKCGKSSITPVCRWPGPGSAKQTEGPLQGAQGALQGFLWSVHPKRLLWGTKLGQTAGGANGSGEGLAQHARRGDNMQARQTQL